MEFKPRRALGLVAGGAALASFFQPEGALSRWLRARRLPVTIVLGAAVAALSWTLTFCLRLDSSPLDRLREPWHALWLHTLPFVVGARVAGCLAFRLHRLPWRHAGAGDLLPLVGATITGSALLGAALRLTGQGGLPRGVLAIEALVCLALLAALRYAWRVSEECRGALGAPGRRRVVVVGAGEAGVLTIRAMFGRRLAQWRPVAILDDDALKQGTTIMGVPVVGPIERVAEVVRRHRAQAIVLAVPSATSAQMYRIARLCRQVAVPLKTIPDVAQILHSNRVVERISDFRVEDLLQRSSLPASVPQIRELLRGRTVLVTGAAGSIGSELCRQIAGQGATALICLDRDENGLFRLEHELRARAAEGVALDFQLGDVREPRRLDELFARRRPEIVFHAAAYKHVPVLQHHPAEAILNNVGGTLNLLGAAERHGVEAFVLISTDKAVNPTSVMGASKRICEHLVRARSNAAAGRYCAIRFGNVLGSNGSVVELFLRQIRQGLPVTVTHPRMERYFMTIAEAVHLVLFAGAMARGGETFILDMGEPVSIDQLARNMIQLSGLVPDVDVPVVYTGLRPGEKLTEELWTQAEQPQATAHPSILAAPRGEGGPPDLEPRVRRLLAAAEAGDLDACWTLLIGLVPTFRGLTNGLATTPPPVAEPPPRPALAVAEGAGIAGSGGA